MKNTLQNNLSIWSLLVAFFFTFSSVNAATCTWIGTSGSWSDPTKWSCGAVPGAADDVEINSGTVTLDVSPTVMNMTLGGTLVGAFDLVITGNLTLTGTLNNNGNVTIGGNFIWNVNFIGDGVNGGTVTVAGLTTFNHANYCILRKKTLILNGGAVQNGNISISNGGIIRNSLGQTFLCQTASGRIITNLYGGSGTIENLGTFVRNSSSELALEGVAFNNSGTYQSINGNITLNGGGTHTGVFSIGNGTVVNFGNGTHDLNGATINTIGTGFIRVNGVNSFLNINTGTTASPDLDIELSFLYATINDNVGLQYRNITITSGTFNTNSNLSASGNLYLAGGVFNFSGNLDVAGTFTWFNGELGNGISNGIVTVAGLTTFNHANYCFLRKKTLVLNGGAVQNGNISISNGGILRIPVGQTFLSQTGANRSFSDAGFGGGGTVENFGIFRRNGSSVLPFSNVFFKNSGNLELINGTLGFGSGFSNLSGSKITGNNSVDFSNPTQI
jgi:hypothetical protein